MKKNLGILFVAVICGVQAMAQSKVTQEFRNAQARVADGVAKVYVKPVVANVEVMNNKVRIKETYPLTLTEVEGLGGNVENIRAYASYLASEKHGCDIILSPLYMIKNDKDTNIYYVTVIGYPAKFVGWNDVKDEDWLWINNGDKSVVEQKIKGTIQKTKN